MRADVQAELELLLEYAGDVTRAQRRRPSDKEAIDAGRAYIGGALTVLAHLELINAPELEVWSKRLRDALPPADYLELPSD